jgi:hypothetical protein
MTYGIETQSVSMAVLDTDLQGGEIGKMEGRAENLLLPVGIAAITARHISNLNEIVTGFCCYRAKIKQ